MSAVVPLFATSQTSQFSCTQYAPRVVVSPRTLASEPVDAVDALAAVGARVGQTFVDVGLAVLAGEARDALAGVPRAIDPFIGNPLTYCVDAP